MGPPSFPVQVNGFTRREQQGLQGSCEASFPNAVEQLVDERDRGRLLLYVQHTPTLLDRCSI